MREGVNDRELRTARYTRENIQGHQMTSLKHTTNTNVTIPRYKKRMMFIILVMIVIVIANINGRNDKDGILIIIKEK